MHKTLLLFFSVLFSTFSFGQVKTKSFSYKLVGVSNIKDLNNQIDTLSLKTIAPAPYISNDIEQKKAKLNAERDALLNRINRRANRDTTVPQGENLPFVEGGFIDSLNTSSVPNDNHLCVGNNGDIISVLNSRISVYKGNGNLVYNVGLSFFGRIERKNNWPNGKQALTGSYDPKAMYDPIADKFIVIWLDGRVSTDTRIVFAVSQTNDAAGSYDIYYLEGNPLNDTSWTDYPILSQSKDDIFITVNLLKDTGSWQTAFKQSIIWEIDKSSIYTNTTFNAELYYNIKHNNVPIWSICPVDEYYKSPRNSMYFLSVRPSDLENDTVFLHQLTFDPNTNKRIYSYQVLKAPQKYGLAGSAYQPGNNVRLQTNDARILTAIQYYGNIQYAHNAINFVSKAPSIMHGSMNNSSGTWSIKNHLISSDSLDFGYPSMAYLGNGNTDHTAMLSFSHSGITAFPGISVVKIGEDLTPSPVLRVKTGTTVINSFLPDDNERWGDYTGLQRKYNEDGVFFLANSMGTSGKPAAGTYIGRLRYNAATGTLEDQTTLIFPNPSNDGIYNYLLNTSKDKPEDKYTLKVYDLSTGKYVYNNTISNLDCGQIQLKLDLSFLSNGIYNLSIIKSANNAEESIIYNHKIQKI